MVWLGIGVKVATLPVIALGVGIGVDYGIYIFARMRESIVHEDERVLVLNKVDLVSAEALEEVTPKLQRAIVESLDSDRAADIVADLQRQKIEDAYGAWIDRLKEKYPVDVNREAWGRLDGFEPGAAPGESR